MTNGGGELSDEVNEPQYHRYTNIGRKGGNEGPSMASLARNQLPSETIVKEKSAFDPLVLKYS